MWGYIVVDLSGYILYHVSIPRMDFGASLSFSQVLYLFLSAFVCLSGFDLCEVGQEEVVLKTGKQANRRTMHFALQSLLALFG